MRRIITQLSIKDFLLLRCCTAGEAVIYARRYRFWLCYRCIRNTGELLREDDALVNFERSQRKMATAISRHEHEVELWTTGADRGSRGVVSKGDYSRGSVRIHQVGLDEKAMTRVDDEEICRKR